MTHLGIENRESGKSRQADRRMVLCYTDCVPMVSSNGRMRKGEESTGFPPARRKQQKSEEFGKNLDKQVPNIRGSFIASVQVTQTAALFRTPGLPAERGGHAPRGDAALPPSKRYYQRYERDPGAVVRRKAASRAQMRRKNAVSQGKREVLWDWFGQWRVRPSGGIAGVCQTVLHIPFKRRGRAKG